MAEPSAVSLFHHDHRDQSGRAYQDGEEDRQVNLRGDQEIDFWENLHDDKQFTKFPDFHDPMEEPSIECKKCDLVLSTKGDHVDHIISSPLHFSCKQCIKRPGSTQAVEFESADILRLHWNQEHADLYCEHCDRCFTEPSETILHFQRQHNHTCFVCGIDAVPTIKLLQAHRRSAEHKNACAEAYTRFLNTLPTKLDVDNVPNHYATLQVDPYSSQYQIFKAANYMRIKTNPGRLKRQGGLTEEQEIAIDLEAARVREASDVLTDPTLRRAYDRRMNV
ncbi:hypothetical protein BDR22DRAFT_569133 [Usnea florida]